MNTLFHDGKMGFSQAHHLGAFVKYAQGTTKIPFFVRENGLNPLWWPEPFLVISQICRDSSLSLRVTLSRVILSETKDLRGFIERHLQYFRLFLPSWKRES